MSCYRGIHIVMDKTSKFSRDRSLIGLFERQYMCNPDKIAVISPLKQLSYNDIHKQVGSITNFILSKNLPKFSVIGLKVSDTTLLPSLMLACINTGMVFVNLDPEDPIDVNAQKISEAKVEFILIDDSTKLTTINCVSYNVHDIYLTFTRENNTLTHTQLSDPQYIIFTSGSTGLPKGIIMPQLAMLNRFNWMWSQYPFSQREIMCQKTSITFVDSIWELFGGLLSGIPTIYFNRKVLFDIFEFVHYIKKFEITRLTITPSYVAQLLLLEQFNGYELPNLKYIILSGEPLLNSLAIKINDLFPHAKLINLYGSSEVSGDVTYYEYPKTVKLDNPVVPIGKPINNNLIYILSENYTEVGPGEIGELYVSGLNLALGYTDQTQTHKRFINLPKFENEVFFKTGDLGKYNLDGNIEYCGRIDRQIKHKGVRIEPAEVENVLLDLEIIELAVVLCIHEQNESQLLAFVKAKNSALINEHEIKTYLKTKLNSRLVPDRIIQVDKFPSTSSGKVDVLALKSKYSFNNDSLCNNATDINSLEHTVFKIITEVLKHNIGIDDNFFDFGLNSLYSIRVLARLKSRLSIRDLTIHDIFNYPSVSQLTTQIRLKTENAQN